MLQMFRTRLQQGFRTMSWPDGPTPAMPDRFAGRPVVSADCAGLSCGQCVQVCPVGAIRLEVCRGQALPALDTGACLFCRRCAEVCPSGAVTFTPEYRMASASRSQLVVTPASSALPQARVARIGRLFGRSLKLRQVSAGGCGACEADCAVLQTLAWDMGRFGIQFVASPRHADGLLVTGPVTRHMLTALQHADAAVPVPKIVIAVGACAIAGGPYAGHVEQCGGVASVLPVDLFIPGCPPHPLTILDGILRCIGRIDDSPS